ncbi:MAG: hypothetical protein WD009_04955 [Phycisphaeraceae bacterium]
MAPYPENPRYLAMDGQPIFAIGATHRHSWAPISRPEEFPLLQDLDRLDAMVRRTPGDRVRGFVRLIAYDPLNHQHDGPVTRLLQPWKRLADGRFDLEQFEPAWEQRLRAFLDAAHERRIVVSLELWDDWSITRGAGGQSDPGPGRGWNGHPFNPNNNVNYDETVLPATTRECYAPFYRTLPEHENITAALALQHRYADRLIDIAGGYGNVLWNVANESRAPLSWSQYWASYLGERLPGRLIGDMPSTNRRDGRGECDPEFNPATLAVDDRYGYVDIAQGVSRHEFGPDVIKQAVGGAARIRAYQQAMIEHGRIKPLVICKEYTNAGPDAVTALWSRFTGGAATARFHRPYGDVDFETIPSFQYAAAERLAQFVVGVAFERMQPMPELIVSDDANINVLGAAGREYVAHLVGRREATELALDLPPGRWQVVVHDAHREGEETQVSTQTLEAGDEPARLALPAHEHALVVHLQRGDG